MENFEIVFGILGTIICLLMAYIWELKKSLLEAEEVASEAIADSNDIIEALEKEVAEGDEKNLERLSEITHLKKLEKVNLNCIKELRIEKDMIQQQFEELAESKNEHYRSRAAEDEFKYHCRQFWEKVLSDLIQSDKVLGTALNPYEMADSALKQYKERFSPK